MSEAVLEQVAMYLLGAGVEDWKLAVASLDKVLTGLAVFGSKVADVEPDFVRGSMNSCDVDYYQEGAEPMETVTEAEQVQVPMDSD